MTQRITLTAVAFLTFLAMPLAARQPAAATGAAAPPAAPAIDKPKPPITMKGPGGSTITFPLTMYDEAADPKVLIAEASARALSDNKRVLLMWGENGCGFCAFLYELFYFDPRLKAVVASEYEVVKIDIGRKNAAPKARELAAAYATPLASTPALTVVDPATGKVVATTHGNEIIAKPMTIERVFDETRVLDFLSRNQAAPVVAAGSFEGAIKKAAESAGANGGAKHVLINIGSPGCEACAAVDAWLARPDVRTILEKQFVIQKIDTQRMIGGNTLAARLTGQQAGSPSWIMLLSKEGLPLSMASRFEGLPDTAEEMAKFIGTLKKVWPKIDAGDLATLEATLKERGNNAPSQPSAPAPKP